MRVQSASSIGRAMGVLGDRWTLLILRDAFVLRSRRFGAWREALGISDPVLARRLRDLVDAGVLQRVPYSTVPERHEYVLTEAGLDLWSLLVAIWAWERRWVHGGAEILPALVHDGCGRRTEPELACAACGAIVGARDTVAERASGAPVQRNAPPRVWRRSVNGGEPHGPPLPFTESMVLLADRWCTVMLAAAFLRTRRFGDFERELGIPPTQLSRRLRTMLDLGVMRRTPPAGRAAQPEYRLTDKGLAFFPVMMLVARWANRWMATPDGPPVRVTHQACGAELDPELRCGACAQPLHRREVRYTF
jgi:DNA-binding HxlR family transcriptional regulator